MCHGDVDGWQQRVGASGPDPLGAGVRAALGGVVRPVRSARARPARHRVVAGAVTLVRIAIGAAVVAPFGAAAMRGRWHLLRRHRRLIAVYGLVAVAVPQFAYFSAVAHMPVAPALLIEFTAPAAVVAWLWLRHGERPGRLTLAGAGVAALGLMLVLDLVSGPT